MILQKTGYDSFFSNVALGIFDGIGSVLWCYGFAASWIFGQEIDELGAGG